MPAFESLAVPLFGCLVCGRIGWRRGVENVVGAGEEAGSPLVYKTTAAPTGGGPWLGDCGHIAAVGTPLAACLDALEPQRIERLVANRPWTMDDWPVSIER